MWSFDIFRFVGRSRASSLYAKLSSLVIVCRSVFNRDVTLVGTLYRMSDCQELDEKIVAIQKYCKEYVKLYSQGIVNLA